jgi:hypothetical protein
MSIATAAPDAGLLPVDGVVEQCPWWPLILCASCMTFPIPKLERDNVSIRGPPPPECMVLGLFIKAVAAVVAAREEVVVVGDMLLPLRFLDEEADDDAATAQDRRLTSDVVLSDGGKTASEPKGALLDMMMLMMMLNDTLSFVSQRLVTVC